jgi:hypothetical protein
VRTNTARFELQVRSHPMVSNVSQDAVIVALGPAVSSTPPTPPRPSSPAPILPPLHGQPVTVQQRHRRGPVCLRTPGESRPFVHQATQHQRPALWPAATRPILSPARAVMLTWHCARHACLGRATAQQQPATSSSRTRSARLCCPTRQPGRLDHRHERRDRLFFPGRSGMATIDCYGPPATTLPRPTSTCRPIPAPAVSPSPPAIARTG